MSRFVWGMFAAIALLLLLMTLSAGAPVAETVRYVVDPQAAVEIERIEAQREMALARERTLRLGMALGVVTLCVVAAGVWGALAMSKRHAPAERMIVLPGSPLFRRLLEEKGGAFIDGVPYYEGEVVEQVEWGE